MAEWKKYLTDDERAELAEADAKKADAGQVARKLKIRCDARIRRERSKSNV